MKASKYLLNALLAAVLGGALLVVMLVNIFAPELLLPKLNIPGMVLISLAALLLEYFIAPCSERCYICIPVLALVSFALLPWASGLAAGMDILKYALIGCIVFTVTTWLFTSAIERISSGKNGKLAAVVSALVLYLAAQGFSGILL